MRKTPTQARAKQRVTRILDATDELIIEHGVAGFSIHEIAFRADVAIRSLHPYFRNRDEVLLELWRRPSRREVR